MAGKSKTVPEQFVPQWMESLDGRTGIAQEMRHRYQAMTADLGGADQLSYAQRSLVSRALWLEYWLQQQETMLATGGDFDVGKWVQAANSLQGILTKLGLERAARDVPDLQTYLKQREAVRASPAGWRYIPPQSTGLVPPKQG